ncbi:unnamed protein product [Didymodactylos carnosus]|uniref:Uncharacterized protein n=1 Tax=Didymodactylos carnosus TaxID=1234261 RepID=A0A8S2FKS2_9BILA|nr:unnamed protein product [Didymodactylos carnosus]CAF4289468.1 unnamed protein product [Didymodactylos carnosus]
MASGQGLTLSPPFFNLKDELSNILQNDHDIKKKLAATLTTNIEYEEVDLNANLNKIVELLESVLLDRLNERLNHLENLIAKIEGCLDYGEKETAHRMVQKNDSRKPPVLIARLYSRSRRYQFVLDKQIFKKLPVNHPMKNVILTEDLSKNNAKPFTTARAKLDKNECYKIYSSNGRIFYRKNVNDIIHLRTVTTHLS